jgi:hypothetical protein
VKQSKFKALIFFLVILSGCSESIHLKFQLAFLISGKPVISSTESTHTELNPIPVTVTFNEPVVGFESGHINITGGSIADFSGTGASYTFNVVPASFGAINISIPENLVTDASGNRNEASNIFVINYVPQVEAYFSAAPNWNDYARTADTSVVCDGTEASYKDCIHGGARRKVELPDVPSCAGLVISDELDIFKWHCENMGGGVRLFTKRLKEKKGLRHLLNPTSFKNNKVIVTGSFNIETIPSAWWANPVVQLPDNSGVTDPVVELTGDPGTIYTLAASRATSGYNFGANKLGIATLETAELSYSGNTNNNCNSSTYALGTNLKCLIAVPSRLFSWIEINADATGAQPFIGIRLAHFFRVHNTHVFTRSHTDQATLLRTRGSMAGTIKHFSGYGYEIVSSNSGVLLESGGLRVDDFKVSGGRWPLQVGADNLFSRVVIMNAEERAVHTFSGCGVGEADCGRNIFVQFIFAGSNGVGFLPRGGGDTLTFGTVAGSTTAFTCVSGGSCTDINYNQILTYNTATSLLNGGSRATASQLAMTKSSAYYVWSEASDGKLGGFYMFGESPGSGYCRIDDTPTNPLIVHNSCTTSGLDESFDYPVGYHSDGVFLKDRDLDDVFIGKVTTDSINASHTTGTATFPIPGAAFDWTKFENPYRVWMADSADPAYWSSGAGHIWDLRINPLHTTSRNRSGDGVLDNENFVVGAICPSAVHGNKAITDMRSPSNTYLLNAFEVLDDDIGNDNGLCESTEACIYAPNIGAYQGEGEFEENTCIFQDGTISGVAMYAYDSVVTP